ncbi:MAG TPA: hypothetical protein ENH55_12220 [Aurantimonas coralicida]|uniref:Uncharacterized protein n=2 Tax=root TaxID=1 RepID=A0A9C9NIM6_9HYPH|nr:hypothetical protein [Aurantimonas coralicida]HEU02600.1 hypothetical protein [Aurantimonas coralicida]
MANRSPDQEILVTKQIAYELGVSPDTVRRMFRNGNLGPDARKWNGRNSPIRMPRKAINRLKGEE